MSAHVICVTSASGLPVFSKSKGNTNTLPFSITGSLNGVHMFSKSHNIHLLDTETQDYKIVWQEFHDSLVLVVVSTGCTYVVLKKILQSVFNAMVLIVGIEEIKAQRNIERLKRELQVCYPVIERLMDSLNCGDASNKHSSDLIMLGESIMCTENHLIQAVLESFNECVDTTFSCVLIFGKIAVASDNWWSLHPEELKLLSLLAMTENAISSKDIPVYLPYKSPNAAFRFVTSTLVPNVQVCVLCGPTPTLQEIEDAAAQCFKNTLETLTSAAHCHPRNFPQGVQMDSAILGVLLINTKIGKYMMSKNPQQNTSKRIASSSHRLDILRTFYYEAVLTHLISEQPEEEQKLPKVGIETYWCSEYHKCHAAKIDDNILCVLYNSSVPTQAMRLITEKTLKTLLSDKQVCW